MQSGFAGVRADLNQPTQGLRINEGWQSRVSVPVLMGDLATPTTPLIFCSNILDEICWVGSGL